MYRPYKHKSVSDAEHFYAVTAISNPVRYKSRYELYHRFKRHMEESGMKFMTVELALGNRSFEVTEAGNPMHVQLRTYDEIWHKENLINIGFSRLPSDWKYVAWIDADIQFLREDWVEETVHLLQRYQIIQMWHNALDMGPDGEVLETHTGFVYSWLNNIPSGPTLAGYYTKAGGYWHSGYSWAARREAIESLGGLYDQALIGSGDHHCAFALINQVDKSMPGFLSAGYERTLKEWERRATVHIKQDIGYMNSSIQHFWHGKKRNRNYQNRWQIVKDYNFDPDLDLKRDSQGLYVFTAAGERLRNPIRAYMNSRNEDSNDTE